VAAVADPGDEPLAGLKRACKAGDRIAARRSLRAWLRLPGAPAGATLLDFAAAVDDAELRAAVYALDSAGFRSGDETDWDGPAFWQRFAAWRQRQAQAGAEPPALTDLYARAGAGPSGKAS
jgi:hypothetical protein